jgi:hypothetical protein
MNSRRGAVLAPSEQAEPRRRSVIDPVMVEMPRTRLSGAE